MENLKLLIRRGDTMKNFCVDINIKTIGACDHIAKLTTYIPDNEFAAEDRKIRPAVLIIPGGGYEYTSRREGEPIALKYASEGICAFVLDYSVAPAYFPQALCEAFLAIKHIRKHAEEWNIDTNKIAVCGFSAGGHLCACVGNFWNAEWLDEYIKVDRKMIKPNLLILSYPVITSDNFTHKESVSNLLGDNKTEEMLELISMEKQVNSDVPPTFIWHTYEDGTVPVKNTLVFGSALVEKGIPVEMHIYRRGWHGLSLGTYMVNEGMKIGEKYMCSDWIDKSVHFIFNEETSK